MVRITGYAKRPEPKWPYVVLFIAGIFTFLVIISFVALIGNLLQKSESTVVDKKVEVIELKPNAQEQPSSLFSGLSVEAFVFTSEINEQNQPSNELSEISQSQNQRVYCYTRIESAVVPETVRHVWIDPEGKILAEITIDILNQPGNVWSYISLADKKVGTWTVEIKSNEGQVLASRQLTISR